MKWVQKQKGFTIVELLIVIVIISILATISIVSYNGVQERAKQSSVQASANQAAKKILLYQTENGSWPVNPAAAGLIDEGGVTYSLTAIGSWFCVIATKDSTSSGMGSNGHCGGLNASYYNNTTMSGLPALTRIDSNLYMSWGTGAPGPNVNSDSISAIWTGYITAPVTGIYTIYVNSDDQVKMLLNGTTVLDAWSLPCCTDYSFTYSFTAGQKVPLRLEWMEGGGTAHLLVTWEYPGQSRITIPTTAFSAS